MAGARNSLFLHVIFTKNWVGAAYPRGSDLTGNLLRVFIDDCMFSNAIRATIARP